jgi:cyclohexadienyl dehydratase
MIRLLFCLAMALDLIALPARADEASRLDVILQRGTLRVGLTGDYPPFSALDPATAKFSGFDVEMAELLGKALGVEVAYVKTSWPQLMKDFEADQFDVAMGGVSITLDRQKKGPFSIPILREGKAPIARCDEVDKYQTIAAIDRPGTRIIVNPGGTNERFDRAHIKSAEIKVYPDNVTIFDELAKGHADLMITDASETRFQQKLHPGILCAVHPDQPFDFAEKGYWLQRDPALKAFVDQWLHMAIEDGSFKKILAAWFD